MGNAILFFAAVLVCFHLASAVRSCDDYKRPLRNSSAVDKRSRQFMNCWGEGVEHGESDLVILMDSSASMGQDGWDRAKDFVDALLTEVKISFDASRVVIGTFTKSHKIDIDYLLNPTFLNTKCRFIKDFKKVKFERGKRTNLRGSLLDAHDIFLQLVNKPITHHLRQNTNKALIVITDGMANTKPNGEYDPFTDVSPEVNKIRSITIGQKLQVEMYAVAVTDKTDVDTMQKKIATDPSMYLYKRTFKDLTDLAKSIRGDAYEKDYETRNVLDSDCEEGCDARADCGCNIRSGKNKCRCRRGYYGTAEKSTKGPTCHKCKVDTYGTKGGLVTGCTKCPDNSGTKGKTGMLLITDCSCNLGYKNDPSAIGKCKKVICSSPSPVSNGFVANAKECKKEEYGAKCIYRCNANYKMVGNDTITCGHEGKYIGKSPECKGLRCPVGEFFNDTTKYKVGCNSAEDTATKTYSIGTACTFSCRDKYYQHGGSKIRRCLHSEKWSGKYIDCRELACPKIVRQHAGLYIKNGTGTTNDCFKTQVKIGGTCLFKCPDGYHVTGSKQVDCKKDADAKKKIGIWFDPKGFVAPNCSDYERPKFNNDSNRCYDGIPLSNNTIKDRNFGLINFGALNITDNSGWFKLVSSPPGYELGRSYPFNITKFSEFTKIEFIAIDAAGNSAKCSFKISIKDNQPPRLLKCPKSPIKVKTAAAEVRVPCETPTYEDNCGSYGKSCRIDITPPLLRCGSKFKKGTSQTVVYKATDPSGNTNERCTFRVEVEAKGCSKLPHPKNGMMITVRNVIGYPTCPRSHRAGQPGFPSYYMCTGDTWMRIGTMPPFPLPGEKLVPDCVAQEPATGVKEDVTIKYQYPANCTSKAVQEQIKEKLKKDFVLCGMNGRLCNETSFDIYCGQIDAVMRRRRSIQQLTARVTIKLTRTKQEAMQDLRGVQLKRQMQNDVIPKLIQRVNSASGLDRIDKNIKGVDSVQASNNPVLACAKKGDVYDKNAKDEGKCYVCPSGQFKNLATGSCQKCPSGTYQPKEGSFSCIKCPKGSTSIGKDASTITSCRSYCKPGEFSQTGLSPCTVAAPGHYAEGNGSKQAKPCPSGTTTVTAGAKLRYDCGTKCQPGTYSETGVEPCKPCEQGSYQQEEGQLNCIQCTGLTWTYGEGADHASKCVDTNACSSNPCLSGGHCVDLKVGFRCECKQGYWGKRCEKEVDECALKPCLNGGKCLDKFQGYLCICPEGVRGKNCEQLYGICKTGVCGSNGECVDLADNSYKCVCNDDYTGSFCETFIDSCQSQPCQNGGVCESRASAYTCRCKLGFTGERCEIKLNFCASEPCKNGGECSDSKYGFICKCTAPYFGVQCEKTTNMCHHTICQHSVACKDLGTDVKCSCKPGYGGKYCDRKLTSDFDIGFQNREAPTFSSIEGKYDLSQFTVAFWMRTSDKENKGTPLSYANKHNGKVDDNALVIADYTSFDLTINNVTANLDFSVNDGEWHHVAITWSSSNGQWIVYKDGTELMRSSTAFQQGQIVRKGGIFIIGEEQDEIGGSFTPTESFFGDMSQLNVWKSVLSSNHIYDLATSCKHASGDVLAWADFSEQSHGSIVKSQPSVACNFLSELREYQSLRGWQLPVSLRSVISTETHNDAKSCAKRCSERRVMDNKCRSFIHDANAKKCTFYYKSTIIEQDESPVRATQFDLYQFSCVKPLGVSDSSIPDSKMTASSSMPGSAPSMARLYNMQTSSSQTFAHWSPSSSDRSPFLEIDLGAMYKITGIATQGHSDASVNEFAGFYTVKYKFLVFFPWLTFSHPISGSRFTANTNSHSIVRNELLLYALKLRILPEKGLVSSRIAMRIEIYGCPERPQGQPVSKPDNNDCVGSSCLNGGTCVDLYRRYACVCPQGFIGSRCQTVAPCPNPDIPVHGHAVSANTGASGIKTSVVVGCLPGYATNDNTRKSCVKGRWIGSNVVCKSKNECATKPCFGNNCQELEGGYRCYCPAGYNLAADGKTCQDINECLIGNGGCNHQCVNNPGSFSCTCNRGYRLEGKLLCVDNDECQGSSHGCEQDCVNTLGSFKCLCKSGYTLNSDGKTCGQTACPYIPNIANGQVTRSRLSVAYSCSTGYQLNGPAVRQCHPDGNWSGEQPTCKRVNCGNLGGETAIISIPSTTYNSVARFSCPTSYSLFGTSTRKCLISGQWSGSQPRCAKSACPRLPNPINGQILGLGRIVGSVARVKCNKGYRLVQTNLELRTCQSNGQWTGGNTAVVTCHIIDCGTPTRNSYVQISLRRGTTYQSAATYSCSQSSGQRCLEGSATRHCNADGKWSGKEPTCIANSCCKPKIPEHSTFYSDNSYFYSDKVYTKCDKGYVTGGTALRTCQNNGQYSGAQTTCTIADCGDPGSVSNGVRMMSATTYLATVKYFCHPGYMLLGSPERVCQAKGQWSGQATSCVKSSCGGKKLGNSGTITTAGGREVCHWLIQVGQGKKVNIDFTSFNIGDKDMVKIYDGQKYEEYITFTKKQKPRSFTGNSHFMRVIYIGEDTSGTGFTLNFKGATCGGHLDSEYGVITSPGYPVSYNPNDECFWTVHRPYQKIQMSFTDFFLQKSVSDTVEMFEGPFQNARMLLYKSYGYGAPALPWADRWIWVHFKVDWVHQDTGFKAVYGIYEPKLV